jgi:hypothetical protein
MQPERLLVSLEYGPGKVDTGFNGPIPLVADPNAGGVELGGTLTVHASNGPRSPRPQ